MNQCVSQDINLPEIESFLQEIEALFFSNNQKNINKFRGQEIILFFLNLEILKEFLNQNYLKEIDLNLHGTIEIFIININIQMNNLIAKDILLSSIHFFK